MSYDILTTIIATFLVGLIVGLTVPAIRQKFINIRLNKQGFRTITLVVSENDPYDITFLEMPRGWTYISFIGGQQRIDFKDSSGCVRLSYWQSPELKR